MKTLLWCLAALWLQAPLHAQVKQLTGHLKGPAGKVLSHASASLKNNQGLILQYAVSNDQGIFTITLKDSIQLAGLLLEVSHLGYKKVSTPLQEGKYIYDIQLEEQAELLPEVEVKSKPIIINKGDTLSYNVKSFSQEEDRSIGDVLRRMPGIDVDDNGKIYYNGKAVANLYIHGDDLMDGRYGLATRAITKELIQSVEVIKNHQPIKVLQNKKPTDDVAINLVLKNENSIAITGQTMLGGGLPKQYDAALNTILLNKHFKMINSLKSNNSGIDYQSDFAQLGSGGFGTSSATSSPSKLLSSGTVSAPDLPRRNYYLNRSGIINLNNLVNNKKGWQFRSNVQGFIDRQTVDYSSTIAQYLSGDTIVYREQQSALRKPYLINTTFTLMANKTRYFLYNKLNFQWSGENNNSQLQSNVQQFGQQMRGRDRSFSNDLSFKPALNNHSVIDIHLYNSYATNPQRLYVDTGLNIEILNDNLAYAAMIQQARVPTWNHGLSIAWLIPKNGFSQEYQVEIGTEQQNLLSQLQLLQKNGTLTDYKGDAGNDLRWQRNKLTGYAKYYITKGRIAMSLNVPFIWQNIRYQQSDYALDNRKSQFFINPEGWLKFRPNVEDYFQLSYRYNNNVGNISGVYRGAILTNYRSLSANDAELQEKRSSSLGLSYSFQRSIIMLFINAGITYNKATVNSIYSSIINNNIQRSILLPYPNDQSSLVATLGLSKYVFALKSTIALKSVFNQGRYNQLVNEQLLPYNNNSLSLLTTIESKPFGKIGLHYNGSINWSYSRQRNVNAADKQPVNRMSRIDQDITLVLSPVKNVFMNFTTRNMYSRQMQDAAISYTFMDLNFRYKYKRWRTDFELDVTNIANVNSYELYRVNSNMFSVARYQIRGRMAILRATFNL